MLKIRSLYLKADNFSRTKQRNSRIASCGISDISLGSIFSSLPLWKCLGKVETSEWSGALSWRKINPRVALNSQ